MGERFPTRHIHYTTPPESRAMLLKSSGQLTSMMGESEWTQSQVTNAAKEFQVPDGMKIALVLPEIFHRDILADAKFEDEPKKGQYKYRFGIKGIKTCCPWCDTNEYVTYSSVTGRTDKIRIIRGYNESIPLKLLLFVNVRIKMRR